MGGPPWSAFELLDNGLDVFLPAGVRMVCQDCSLPRWHYYRSSCLLSLTGFSGMAGRHALIILSLNLYMAYLLVAERSRLYPATFILLDFNLPIL